MKGTMSNQKLDILVHSHTACIVPPCLARNQFVAQSTCEKRYFFFVRQTIYYSKKKILYKNLINNIVLVT